VSNKAKDAVVIIPHYNDVTRLNSCLTALLDAPPDVLKRVEIVVADNASTQDIGPLKAAFPTVRFLHQPIKGAAAARNMAVQNSSAPLLFFTDADCIPDPTWLATAFDTSRQADLVGGRVNTFDETPAPRSGAEAFEAVFAFNQRAYVEDKSFSVTANLVTSRVIFDDVGEFVVGRSEDMDWCHRARDKGYKITYADNLTVKHPTRQTWADLRRKWLRITSETYETTTTSRARWMLDAGVVFASAFAHIPKVLNNRSLASREKGSAIFTLLRLRGLRVIWIVQLALGGKIT
jgi:GT2 family glycosyltransferase